MHLCKNVDITRAFPHMFQDPAPVYRPRKDASGLPRSSSFDGFPQFNGDPPWHSYHSADEFEPDGRKHKRRKEKIPKTPKGKKDKSRPGRKKKRSKSTNEQDVDNSSKASSLRGEAKIDGLTKGKAVLPAVGVLINESSRCSTASGDVSKSPSKGASAAVSSITGKMTTQTYILEPSTKKKIPACVFWKYIFYLGLVIFGAIIGVVAYTFYNKGEMALKIQNIPI